MTTAMAWAKAAVAGAALVVGAPVWGAGPKESFDDIVKSGHWTFEIGRDAFNCDITGYANPDDIHSDQISIFNILVPEGNYKTFAMRLDFSEQNIANFKNGDHGDFFVVFIHDRGEASKINLAFNIGSELDGHQDSLFKLTGPLGPFSLILSTKTTNVVWIVHGKNRLLEIPVPENFYELAENCMDESAKRLAERYGKAK